MGINAKHAYRFGFLKSESWEGTRKIALAQKHARCEICHRQDWSNDVHHARYGKNLHKPWWADLHVVCRTCHQIVHFVMDHRKAMGAKDNKKSHWRNIQRSAKRILKMAIKTGSLEISLARTSSIYKELEISHDSVKRPLEFQAASHNRNHGPYLVGSPSVELRLH